MNGGVRSLAVYDDGSGPALYAGGTFNIAGGVAAERIAKWNGSSWAPLGSGVSGGASTNVMALVVHDDGGGPALYAGGTFTVAGGGRRAGSRSGTARAGPRSAADRRAITAPIPSSALCRSTTTAAEPHCSSEVDSVPPAASS
jgi:hypothetical protein